MTLHQTTTRHITTRPITTSERAAFYNAQRYAFNFWSDETPDEADLDRIDLGETLALFEDETLAATLTNIGFQQSVRGVLKPLGGVAGVATLPTFRRRGHVRKLLDASFEEMRAKGQVVGALHPFRQSFYARFGYVYSNRVLEVATSSDAFAPFSAHSRPDDDWQVERLPGADVRERLTAFLREVAAPRYSGYVLDPDRSDAVWQHNQKDYHVAFVTRAGQDVATVRYKIESTDDGPLFRIREWHWRDLAARDRLCGYLALHAEQTPRIHFPSPEGVHFQRWLQQPAAPIEPSINRIGLMLRIVDVPGALDGLPAPVDGELVIEVRDEQCAWNNGRYALKAGDGRLSAEPTQADAALVVSIEGLTALAYGILDVEAVVHRGWLQGAGDEERALLTAWFPVETIYNPYFF